jgi:mono/diheme cytochrome c family protein
MRKLLSGGSLSLVLSLAIFLATPVIGAAEVSGKIVFDRWCIHCHDEGPGNAGTLRLAIDRGEDRSVLEKRTDLSAQYVKAIVRNGINQMPGYRLLEISDEELEKLANYLTNKR